ncbi:MAG: hypothetical protein WC874_00885 [Candidatus Izemoplasmatales bacterium]|jgi:hypothetical protein
MSSKVDRILEVCFQVFLTLAIFNGSILATFSWSEIGLPKEINDLIFRNFIIDIFFLIIVISFYIYRGEDDNDLKKLEKWIKKLKLNKKGKQKWES